MRRSFLTALLTCTIFLIGCLPYVCHAGDEEVSTANSRTVRKEVLLPNSIWETPYFVIDSGEAGPTVMLVGGMHGNEPAGARAAEQICGWELSRGKLVIVPAANRSGLANSHRRLHRAAGPSVDLNRQFPTATVSNPNGQLATAIWNLTLEHRPTFVLDLHEGYEFNISHEPGEGKKKSVGSSLIYRSNEELETVANRAIETVNRTIDNPDRKFVKLSRGAVRGSWVHACAETLDIDGMILETTYKDQPLSTRTRQHRTMVEQVLLHFQMIQESQLDRLVADEPNTIVVGLFDGPGTSRNGRSRLTRLIDADQRMEVRHLGPVEMRDEVLKQFDLLIFPGGSGSAQGRSIGESGREALREFTREGGDLLGICAGAYLCSSHYSWSLHVIDTHVYTGARETPAGPKQVWYRGGAADIDVELTELGRQILPEVGEQVVLRYQNGPIVSPHEDSVLPDYRVLAYFRSENGLYPVQVGTMVDTPAIVTARYGEGDVLSVSPHPEATEGHEQIITRLIEWAYERE